MQTLTKIRHALVWEQHQVFLETLYEELPPELTNAVPRAFWKRPSNQLLNSCTHASMPVESETEGTVRPSA